MHPHPRILRSEALQDLWHHRVNNVVRHAQRHFALEFLRGQAAVDFIVQRQHPPCIAQQLFAVGRQRNTAGRTIKQRYTHRVFKPFELHRHRRLRQVQHTRRLGDAAGIGHGDKGAQGGEIKIAWHINIRDA